MEFEMGIVRC